MAFSISHARCGNQSARELQHFRITAGRAEAPCEGQDKEAGWGEGWMGEWMRARDMKHADVVQQGAACQWGWLGNERHREQFCIQDK